MPLIASGSRLIRHRASTAWYLAGGISASNCIAAYAPKGAASQAASYTNLANPGTNNAAPGTAPTWDATSGWTFAAASSQYLKTGILPQAGYTMIIRFSNYVASAGAVLAGGEKDANTKFYIFPRRDSGASNYRQYGYGNNSRNTALGTGVTNGVIGMAGDTKYYNAVSDGTAGTFTGTGCEIYIAAYNANPTPLLFSSVYIQAMSLYNTALTLAQVQALTTAMNAL